MSNCYEPQKAVTTQGTSFVATSVSHLWLLQTDSESVRVFLRLYDQYCKEVLSRPAQRTATGSISTEAVQPVNIKYCVDPEYLESAIALGFIEATSYDELSEIDLREHLDQKAQESQETITLETLDEIVDINLRMNKKDKNSKSRMESLFVSYHSLLRRNGLSWLIEPNPKVAVYHVLSAIKPKILHDRLSSDLQFSKHSLKKDFKDFMKHAVHVSEAFQRVDSGPDFKKKRSGRHGNQQNRSGGHQDRKPHGGYSRHKHPGTGPRTKRAYPDCPFGPCKGKGLKHLIKDCPDASVADKDRMFAELAANRAKDGHSKSTRRQKASAIGSRNGTPKADGTAGRLSEKVQHGTLHSHPSCPITVSDGQAAIKAIGRCDDGRDEIIVSPSLAERAAVRGVGKITAITPVRLSVALKAGQDPETFSFSRSWTSPRTVLHLSSGQLALSKVTFLVADDDLSCEDLLLGLPVLRHLQVDTRTLLEGRVSRLDCADCSHIGYLTTISRGGSVTRMMIARLNRVREKTPVSCEYLPPNRPRVHYHTARTEREPFPNPSLLDSLDEDQHEDVRRMVGDMVTKAKKNGMPSAAAENLDRIVRGSMDVFRNSLSSGPPAKIRSLKIELTADAKPVKVRLRNYSQEQREFLSKFVQDLVEHKMVYLNQTSQWASALLLVHKPGPAKFRFTVDLRPVNKYTIKHQFPMPNLEHELNKLSGSQFYATFDL